ncbi:hypothetical protein [Leptolyngbya sp. FACHB-17]|nr:hypothetical protein [Leptolyngbya sp. FACHB-17]
MNSEPVLSPMAIAAWLIRALILRLVAWGFLAERRNSERRYTTS